MLPGPTAAADGAGNSPRPSERFAPSQHLRSAADFDEVRRLGRRAETGPFTLRLRLRTEGPRRLGIIASRRAGPSVERNRAKRLIREVFRRNVDALPPSCDVVAIIRAGFVEFPFEEIRERYLKALKQMIKK